MYSRTRPSGADLLSGIASGATDAIAREIVPNLLRELAARPEIAVNFGRGVGAAIVSPPPPAPGTPAQTPAQHEAQLRDLERIAKAFGQGAGQAIINPPPPPPGQAPMTAAARAQQNADLRMIARSAGAGLAEGTAEQAGDKYAPYVKFALISAGVAALALGVGAAVSIAAKAARAR
jgi:hypothetical protein